MQAPIGENSDCWQVWLISAFRSARSTRFDHSVAVTKQSKDYYQGEELRAPVKRLKLSLQKHQAGVYSYRSTMQFSIADVASV